MRRLLLLLIALSASLSDATGAAPSLELIAQPDRVELATSSQKLLFARGADGTFALTTFVRDGRGWRAFFDAGRPLLEGPSFGSQPTGYAVAVNSPARKAVEFTGRHTDLAYDWSLRVEAATNSPLFHFTVTCELPDSLPLRTPQPVVALWMKCASPAFHLDQGPDSVYGSAGIPHCYGFPAACLWDDGREAAVFFNMTPMRWMRRDGVCRFNDVRIMAGRERGQTGLGMHFKKVSGPHLPGGTLAVEFFLHQSVRSKQPTGLEALDTMVRAFAPLHPVESVFPLNHLTGGPVSWEQFARQAMADLMAGPEICCEIKAPWRDQPLQLVPAQETMIVHSGSVMPSTNQTCQLWDFSTVNNHLTPWLLLARLNNETNALRLALRKKDALPRFYDPRSRLIRHGTRNPPHLGDLEMTWQNLFFHVETLRAAAAAPPQDFNPAVAGRFLMATAGLRDLAGKTDFVFPQWFDPYRKQPVVQNDLQKLGVVREPWQAGAYAHLMIQAFELTSDRRFLAEARRALEALMERMQFQVHNEVYDRSYADPADFPITELFGNAHGIAAAHRLYEVTGEAKFLRYSRDFLNTLLRLTFWYDDETDPVSRELRNAGLFYPHGGAHVATPWETSEAHLMIAWTLKHDPGHPLTDLLLKLSNLNRVNSFYFFPAAWSDTVRALDPHRGGDLGQYFPIEPFYDLEGGGGHRGPTAAYMAGLALWNDWLYEALAEANDREIMVLNLDVLEDYEAALTGVERHFLAFNPGSTNRTCRIQFKHLPEAGYLVTAGARDERHSATELAHGLPLTLRGQEHLRLTLRRSDHLARQLQLQQAQGAQCLLARCYQLLQTWATEEGTSSVPPQAIDIFVQARRACVRSLYSDVPAAAQWLLSIGAASGVRTW
jgi:hypothetical protein